MLLLWTQKGVKEISWFSLAATKTRHYLARLSNAWQRMPFDWAEEALSQSSLLLYGKNTKVRSGIEEAKGLQLSMYILLNNYN